MGVRTLQLDDRPVEVWYPVEPTAVEGQTSEIFDSINAISEVLRPFIPGDLGGEVDTGTYRDAPPATEGGPFPTAAYSHGSPGYRQAATFLTGHLASHGVITIAVEHLGRSLSTLLTPLAGADTPEDDVTDLLNALDLVGSDPGLGSVVDTSRMVVIGHSAGARTAALATADHRVVGVALLAGVPQELATNRPALMVAFENDALIDPAGIWSLHQSLDNSVFVNIAGTGHAAPIDACPLIQDRGGLTELREALGEAIVRAGEDGCLPKDTDARAVQDLLRIYITGFVYEALGLSTGPVNLTAEAADLVAGVELRGFNEPPTTTAVPTATVVPATTQAPTTTTPTATTTVTGSEYFGPYTLVDEEFGTMVTVTVDGSIRTINSNALPDHETGDFPNNGNPNTISEQDVSYGFTTEPTYTGAATGVRTTGVAVNGVKFEPATAETVTCATGEIFRIEALQDIYNLGFDFNNAHVQSTGEYHYHGISQLLVEAYEHDDDLVHVGFAADGFLMYYSKSGVYESGYGLAMADRTGTDCVGSLPPRATVDIDGTSPDGTYTSDWTYSEGGSELDSCNGITIDGEYLYVITDDYPYVGRCLNGEISASAGEPGGGPSGGLGVGGPGEGPGGPLDLTEAAEALGVTLAELQAALGPPPPNVAGAASTLGVDVEVLRELIGGP